MQNNNYNQYHPNSRYRTLPHDQTAPSQPQRPNRMNNGDRTGNFIPRNDGINNWNRVRDNGWGASRGQRMLGGVVQPGVNTVQHPQAAGGHACYRSQPQEQPYQINSNEWDAMGSEVDQWGRDIRGRQPSPEVYDERPIKALQNEYMSQKMHTGYTESRKRTLEEFRESRNTFLFNKRGSEDFWEQEGARVSPKRPRHVQTASLGRHQELGPSHAIGHRQPSFPTNSLAMPTMNTKPLKGDYNRNHGGKQVTPHELSKANHQYPSRSTHMAPVPAAPYSSSISQQENISADTVSLSEVSGKKSVGGLTRPTSALANRLFRDYDGALENVQRSMPPRVPQSPPRSTDQTPDNVWPERPNVASLEDSRRLECRPENSGTKSWDPPSSLTPVQIQDEPALTPQGLAGHSMPEEPINTLKQTSSHCNSLVAQLQIEALPVSIPPEILAIPESKGEWTSRVDIGESFEFLRLVGVGSYGKVFKARDKQSGRLVALKKIKTESQKDGFPVTALREVKLLQSLHHENVLLLREMVIRKGAFFLNFEYVEHDLVGLLRQKLFELKPEHTKSLAHQLMQGLEYIHSKGVLHRDLKSANLLITCRGTLKLGDFGLARSYNKRRKLDYTNRVCTLLYRCPEIILGETVYGPEIDIWSAGCIFMELLLKDAPFQTAGDSDIDQMHLIYSIFGTPNDTYAQPLMNYPWYNLMMPPTKSENCFRTKYASILPADAMDFAEALLQLDGSQRPSAVRALEHSYFSSAPYSEPPDLTSMKDDFHEYECRKQEKRPRAEPSQTK